LKSLLFIVTLDPYNVLRYTLYMKLPITKNFDNSDLNQVLGWAEATPVGLEVTMEEPITLEQVYEIFGSCAVLVHLEREGLISKFRIVEWAIVPKSVHTGSL
jgi:hypothetical protein